MAQEKVIDFNLEPVERLKLELENNDDTMELAIGNKLLELFEKDTVLKNCYKDRKVKLSDIRDFVNEKARTYLNNQNGCIEDKVVFGWAIHYIQDEPFEITNEDKYSIQLTENEKENIKEKAIQDFYESERKKLEEKRQAKLKKEKKRLEETGQMTLF